MSDVFTARQQFVAGQYAEAVATLGEDVPAEAVAIAICSHLALGDEASASALAPDAPTAAAITLYTAADAVQVPKIDFMLLLAARLVYLSALAKHGEYDVVVASGLSPALPEEAFLVVHVLLLKKQLAEAKAALAGLRKQYGDDVCVQASEALVGAASAGDAARHGFYFWEEQAQQYGSARAYDALTAANIQLQRFPEAADAASAAGDAVGPDHWANAVCLARATGDAEAGDAAEKHARAAGAAAVADWDAQLAVFDQIVAKYQLAA